MSFILPSIGGGIIASPTTPAFSNSYSVEFDGSDDHASTAFVTDDFDLKDGFTVSLWVNLDSVSGTQDFFGRYGSSTSRFYFGTSGSNLRVAIGTSFNTTSLSHGLSTGSWSHVAYTFTGGSSGTFTYYVNGSSVGTISFTWTFDNVAYEPMHIGALKNGANTNQNPTNGKLDEMAIFNSALSASDITAIYNSGTPNDISSLNPVGWWRMGDNNSGSGTTITDQGSGGNDATLTNGPTFSTDVPTTTAFSNTHSVAFDGSNDHGVSSYVASSSLTAISYSFWMKSSNTTSSMTLGVSDTVNTNAKSFRILSPSTTKAYYVIVNDGTGNYLNTSVGGQDATISGANNIRDGLWHHLVFTISGTSVKIYIDGGDAAINASNSSNSEGHALSATSTKSYAGGANSYFLGKNGTFNSYYFDGLMDEVAIFEYELTASQVRSIYNSGTPENLASYSPNVWWRMGDNDGGTGTTITDQGSAGQNLTLTNGPTFSTTVP